MLACRRFTALVIALLALPAHAELQDDFQVHTDKISDADLKEAVEMILKS